MNTANPQLEGLYLAFASINRLLVDKGLVTHGEIQKALQNVERAVLDDTHLLDISGSHQMAVAFPIRVLLQTRRRSGATPSISRISPARWAAAPDEAT